jgi:tRNA(Arg) A34 adenosine deaminase TadA
MHENYMQMAIAKAKEGKNAPTGGAFGAVIVLQDEVVCAVHNQVKKEQDITQHAELHAIQMAAKKLGKDGLKDCVLYTRCEPCMMCLGACHWAQFKAIYFGASALDAKDYGYVYSNCYYEMDSDQRHKEFRMTQLLAKEAIAVWEE